VLIVDDISDARAAIRVLLHNSGCDCSVAASGREAIDCLDRDRHDLVILDNRLPDLGGVDVCRHVRRRRAFDAIPIVIYSASDLPSDIAAAREAGAADYWVKGRLDPDEMAGRVTALIAESASDRQAAAAAAEAAIEADARAANPSYASPRPATSSNEAPTQPVHGRPLPPRAGARPLQPGHPLPGLDAIGRYDRGSTVPPPGSL
jgi:DNA-binding response OmpR family regulator